MKKRILPGLLAMVLLLYALPISGYAAVPENPGLAINDFAWQALPRYSVAASPDVAADVGQTVSMYVTVSGAESYNAYDLKLTYDADLLTYKSCQAADEDALIIQKNGSIRIIGYGADKPVSTAVVTLQFTTKAAGTAKAVISEARVDCSESAQTKDAPKAAILDDTTLFVIQARYPVTLEEGLTADRLTAGAGEDYTFRATDPLHYDYKPSATIDGKDITVRDNGDGTYTIPGSEITGGITVKANRTPKTYQVTLEGEDLQGEKTAAYNTPYHFKLDRKDGYRYTLSVTIGGKAYTGFQAEDGGYVIPGADITGDIVITAQKTKADDESYVSVSFIGSGAKDASGKTSTRRGVEYSFRINRKKDFTYTVSVRVNGVRVRYDYDGEKDIYYIPADVVTGDITITVTKLATVEVSTYITLDKQSMYLIVFNGHVKKERVPMYDGQCMFWSDAYGAYAWLVVSSDDEKTVRQAAQGSITTGHGTAAAQIDYSGNVDLDGRTDVDDVLLAYDMYNAKYTLEDMQMGKFLNADVNGDRKVDVMDAVWIVARILSRQ